MSADFKVGMVFKADDLASTTIRAVTKEYRTLIAVGKKAAAQLAATSVMSTSAPQLASTSVASVAAASTGSLSVEPSSVVASPSAASLVQAAPVASVVSASAPLAAAAAAVGSAGAAAAGELASATQEVASVSKTAASELETAMKSTAPSAETAASGIVTASKEIASATKTAAHEFEGTSKAVPAAAQKAEGAFARLGRGVSSAAQRGASAIAQAGNRVAQAANAAAGALGHAEEALAHVSQRAAGAFDFSTRLHFASESIGQFAERSKGVLEKAFDVGNEFERAMSALRSKTDGTEESFRALRTEALHLGETTLYSSTQAAEGMEILAQQGWTTKQVLAGTSAVMDLATAANIDFKDATLVTTSALEGFQIDASKVASVADIIAYAANASAADVGELGEAFSFSSAEAHALGISIGTTAAMLAALHNAGIKGSRAGTSFQELIAGFSGVRRGPGHNLLAELGIQTADKQGNFIDPITLIHELKAATKKYGSAQVNLILGRIFGQAGSSGVLALMNSTKLDSFVQDFTPAHVKGAARATAAITADNTSGSLTRLHGATENLYIAIHDQLAPVLRPLVDTLAGIVRGITAWTQRHPILTRIVVVSAAAVTALATAASVLLSGLAALVGLVGVAQLAMGGWAIATNLVQLSLWAVGAAAGWASSTFLAFSAAMLASPITWIVAGIALLVVGAVLLVKHWSAVKKFFVDTWNWLEDHFGSSLLFAIFVPIIGIPLVIAKHWTTIKSVFVELWDWLLAHAEWAAVFVPIVGIPALIVKYWSPLKRFFAELWAGIKAVFHLFVEGWKLELEPIIAALKFVDAHIHGKPATPVAPTAPKPSGPPTETFVERLEDFAAWPGKWPGRKGVAGQAPDPTKVGGELKITIDQKGRIEAEAKQHGPMILTVDTGLGMRGS